VASPFPQADSPPFMPQRHVANRRELPVSIVGLVFVVAGAVLQLLALVSVTWIKGTVGKVSVEFTFADFMPRAERGLAYIYFSWGAWVLLALSVALGVAACVRWSAARQFRIAGALLGVLGAVVAICAVLVFAYQSHLEALHVARNYTLGLYLEVLGLLATAFGAAAGGIGTGTVGLRP
jgi:hypothetical protein